MDGPSPHYLATILTHARDAILSMDLGGVVRTANRGAEQLFDRPASLMVGRPIAEVGGGEWAEALPEMVLAVSALAYIERDVACDRPDGSAVFVGLVLATFNDESGNLGGISAIGRDMTEHRRALLALARSNADLEQFAFAAAHDLQEPLRTIRMLGSILEEWCSEGEAQEYLARMQRSATDMQALVDGLCEYARLSNGAPAMVAVSLDAVAADVLDELRPDVEARGARIELGPLPVVRGAPDELRVLLRHLVRNAMEFAHPGLPPHLGIRGVEIDGERVLRVHDDGVGFDQRYAERLFTPFRRLHAKDEHPGAGLGLAVCRRIMERHGGHLTAVSAPGHGATFSARFPA